MKYYIDFITKNATDRLTTFEKIKMIIRLVRQNRVLIMESGLTSEEEIELIKQTMIVYDYEHFNGLEYFNWDRANSHKKFFKKPPFDVEGRFTVIAPSTAIQIIENNSDLLSIELNKTV